VGMETAPARMISNAQTVAKMGRRMKKSTKVDLALLAAASIAEYLEISG